MTEWNASAYHDRAALQRWLAEASLANLELEGAEAVLDLGCGDGRITAEIAQRLPDGKVLGVDPSRQMVDFARRTYNAPNLRFETGDARALPYQAEFDLLVSFNALHWALPVSSTLAPIRASLRPGGRALLQLVGLGERKSLEEVLEDTRQQPGWSPFFVGFQAPFEHPAPYRFRLDCLAAGMRVDSFEMASREWDFGDRTAFMSWLAATTSSWTSRLPEERRDDFLSDFLTAYGTNVFRFYQLVARLRVPVSP